MDDAREEEAEPCGHEPELQGSVEQMVIVRCENSTGVLASEARNVSIAEVGHDTNCFPGAPHGAPGCTTVTRPGTGFENISDVTAKISS